MASSKPKVIVKRIVIPPMQAGKLNVFNAEQIGAAGGIEAFSKLIGNETAKQWPVLDFSEEEWEAMLRAEERAEA